MALSTAHITSTFDQTNVSAYTVTPVTLTAGRLYTFFIAAHRATGASAAPTITGQAGTWTFIATTPAYNGGLRAMHVFQYVPAGNEVAITLTITFAATQANCITSLLETTGFNAAAVLRQVNYNTDTGVVQLTGAFGPAPLANNHVIAAVQTATATGAITTDPTFTTLGTAAGTGTAADSGNIESEFAVAKQSCTPSFGGTRDAAIMLVEINEASNPPAVAPRRQQRDNFF